MPPKKEEPKEEVKAEVKAVSIENSDNALAKWFAGL